MAFLAFLQTCFRNNYLYLRFVRQIWRQLLYPCCMTSDSSVQILFLSGWELAAYHPWDTCLRGQQGVAGTETTLDSLWMSCPNRSQTCLWLTTLAKRVVQDGPAGSICLGSRPSSRYHDVALAQTKDALWSVQIRYLDQDWFLLSEAHTWFLDRNTLGWDFAQSDSLVVDSLFNFFSCGFKLPCQEMPRLLWDVHLHASDHLAASSRVPCCYWVNHRNL